MRLAKWMNQAIAIGAIALAFHILAYAGALGKKAENTAKAIWQWTKKNTTRSIFALIAALAVAAFAVFFLPVTGYIAIMAGSAIFLGTGFAAFKGMGAFGFGGPDCVVTPGSNICVNVGDRIKKS